MLPPLSNHTTQLMTTIGGGIGKPLSQLRTRLKNIYPTYSINPTTHKQIKKGNTIFD